MDGHSHSACHYSNRFSFIGSGIGIGISDFIYQSWIFQKILRHVFCSQRIAGTRDLVAISSFLA